MPTATSEAPISTRRNSRRTARVERCMQDLCGTIISLMVTTVSVMPTSLRTGAMRVVTPSLRQLSGSACCRTLPSGKPLRCAIRSSARPCSAPSTSMTSSTTRRSCCRKPRTIISRPIPNCWSTRTGSSSRTDRNSRIVSSPRWALVVALVVEVSEAVSEVTSEAASEEDSEVAEALECLPVATSILTRSPCLPLIV